ncbi:hypothetical protein [Sphingobium aquiterrae]|uniref:hypothetical protein n=1 Tax=Sphingobium aquiterrae TaxID=2038656 RepID=UPI00301A63E8
MAMMFLPGTPRLLQTFSSAAAMPAMAAAPPFPLFAPTDAAAGKQATPSQDDGRNGEIVATAFHRAERAADVRTLPDQIRMTGAVDFHNIATMANAPGIRGLSVSTRF